MTKPDEQRGDRRHFGRVRLAWTGIVLLVVAVVGLTIYGLSSRNASRLELVNARLQDTGRFAEARARLQQRTLESLPPVLSAQSAFVQDIRIQIEQARRLGERLDSDSRVVLDRLTEALSQPLVSRDDLLAAAAVLAEIVDAESVVQERIFADARRDAGRETALTLGALLLLGLFSALTVWNAPRMAATAPVRKLLRASIRTVFDQRRSLLRAERVAVAAESAATLAHELRNPLAGVAMGLQNLERDLPEQASRITPMVAELQRVSRTLNEHLGALRAPAEAPRDMDLAQMVDELVELLTYEAGQGVRIEHDVPEPLRARLPQDRVRQVLLNLGLNAIQAVDGSGGQVVLEGRRSEGGVELVVRDSGPGFPEQVLNGATGPLVSSKPGGSGVGLRLVRRLVEEMGGRIELSNPPGGGAQAVVTLMDLGEHE
ncbi:MAG: HAMP domain-containing sensor histidine kinase [Gemmatimonadota bacterium]